MPNTNTEESVSSANGTPSDRPEYDVVVVGAGMAGLVSATRCVENGATVVVLEKGPRAGGSMYLSNGVIYTYDSFEAIREAIPDGDPVLQELIVESKDDALAWLSDVGAEVKDPVMELSFGDGKTIDPKPFTQTMVEFIEDGDGEVRLNAPMESLETDADGRVVGVTYDSGSGTRRIRARNVILATGGFQGNEMLVEQFITDDSDTMWLRSNPWSTGDGLLEAQDVGAKTTGGMDSFYGHNLPAPPAEIPAHRLYEAKQDYGVFAVAVDTDGERFTDETATKRISDGPLCQDTAKLADGLAYLIIDDDIYTRDNRGSPPRKRIDVAEEMGGRVASAESFAELGTVLDEWGVNGERAIETLEAFNDGVESDSSLVPPRQDFRDPIDTPPYHVVEVQPGITFTMGGLDVTSDMSVVRRGSSSSTLQYFPSEPNEMQMETIPGLYAAGVDVGKVMDRYYSGGLIVGLVTGRIAADSATADA